MAGEEDVTKCGRVFLLCIPGAWIIRNCDRLVYGRLETSLTPSETRRMSETAEPIRRDYSRRQLLFYSSTRPRRLSPPVLPAQRRQVFEADLRSHTNPSKQPPRYSSSSSSSRFVAGVGSPSLSCPCVNSGSCSPGRPSPCKFARELCNQSRRHTTRTARGKETDPVHRRSVVREPGDESFNLEKNGEGVGRTTTGPEQLVVDLRSFSLVSELDLRRRESLAFYPSMSSTTRTSVLRRSGRRGRDSSREPDGLRRQVLRS